MTGGGFMKVPRSLQAISRQPNRRIALLTELHFSVPLRSCFSSLCDKILP
jgi:hypothetical protein